MRTRQTRLTRAVCMVFGMFDILRTSKVSLRDVNSCIEVGFLAWQVCPLSRSMPSSSIRESICYG